MQKRFNRFEKKELAKRDLVSYRYDLLDANFERFQAQLAAYGAKKYGDGNWKRSRLSGENGPVNHMREHLTAYINKEAYDHVEIGTDPKFQLVAVAFNAMMEFFYESHPELYADNN